jgi:hypothetical protein
MAPHGGVHGAVGARIARAPGQRGRRGVDQRDVAYPLGKVFDDGAHCAELSRVGGGAWRRGGGPAW